jgi:hypothetical protein
MRAYNCSVEFDFRCGKGAAGYLITLTHAPSWEAKFGDKAAKLSMAARDEFGKTAKAINRRAEQIGAEPSYDESWGEKR